MKLISVHTKVWQTCVEVFSFHQPLLLFFQLFHFQTVVKKPPLKGDFLLIEAWSTT